MSLWLRWAKNGRGRSGGLGDEPRIEDILQFKENEGGGDVNKQPSQVKEHKRFKDTCTIKNGRGVMHILSRNTLKLLKKTENQLSFKRSPHTWTNV